MVGLLQNQLKAALSALIKAHPYQEVAYGALPIITLDNFNE